MKTTLVHSGLIGFPPKKEASTPLNALLAHSEDGFYGSLQRCCNRAFLADDPASNLPTPADTTESLPPRWAQNRPATGPTARS
ncbi:hypothetical protein ACO2Q8_08470 [Larkinella sp. VNQ87]|uniref:hypothetical protein n=1 Tax=Larkinella sp. VNQ87 TaxID=3400921 RepID=UPI003BFD064A